MITFKKATIQDIPQLLEIERSVAGTRLYSAILTEEGWNKELGAYTVYFIERDAQTVGVISFQRKSPDSAFVSELVVMPKFQRQGIGRTVFGMILEELKDVRQIDLFTHPENYARKLYESFGFVAGEQVENYYGDGEPRIWLHLKKGV